MRGRTRTRTRIIINGREVRSPLARALLGLLVLPVAALLGLVLFLILLPLAGIALAVAIGLAGLVLGAIAAAAVQRRRRAPGPGEDDVIEGSFVVEDEDKALADRSRRRDG